MKINSNFTKINTEPGCISYNINRAEIFNSFHFNSISLLLVKIYKIEFIDSILYVILKILEYFKCFRLRATLVVRTTRLRSTKEMEQKFINFAAKI